jgi:hypothetical protein
MFYKLPTRRKKKPSLEKPVIWEQEDNEQIGYIQGQAPDSKEEWWISKALDRLGLSYTYQYPVNGGRQRGGYLIDFVVHTVPLWTMIEPEGNHWHTGELGSDDKKRDADVENLMQDLCRTPMTKLWIPDMIDEDAVYNKLIQELT